MCGGIKYKSSSKSGYDRQGCDNVSPAVKKNIHLMLDPYFPKD